MRRVLTVLAIGVLLIAGTELAMAQRMHPDKEAGLRAGMNKGVGQVVPSPRGFVGAGVKRLGAPVTVRYDTGTVTGQSVSPGNRCFGNRFDTSLGAPLGPGNEITQITFFLAGLGGNGVFITVFDQLNTGAATANSINDFLFTTGETPIVNNALNTWVMANAGEVTPAIFAGSSVLAGVWNTAASTGTDEDAVGFDSSGTTQGQGFHGMGIDFGGGAYSPLDVTNAVFRITGPQLPVELMNFSVEDE